MAITDPDMNWNASEGGLFVKYNESRGFDNNESVLNSAPPTSPSVVNCTVALLHRDHYHILQYK